MAARTRPNLCAVAQSPANSSKGHSRKATELPRLLKRIEELAETLDASRAQIYESGQRCAVNNFGKRNCAEGHQYASSLRQRVRRRRKEGTGGAVMAGEAGVTPRYFHPRTGEKRKHIQPLRIDRLGSAVKDAIIAARASGEAWARVAEMASAAAGQKLSRTSVQRWYDLRIEQQSTGAALREIIELLKSILKAVQP